ncbi:MAG: 50S ribosomal protein L10 [Spirochaetes bacterium]|nr:50S ribosomal protein L10 [Spirochaetota bacterium]
MAQRWKEDRLEKIKGDFKEYQNFIFTDYRGLNVEQITSLRTGLREKEVEYHVVKNRLAKRAFDALGYSDADRFLTDPTAIAYFNVDISDVCKVLVDFTKETSLSMKGGLVEGGVITEEDIRNIAMLPSRQSLIGKTVLLLNSPINGLASVLGSVITKFLLTLKAVEASKN